MCFERAGARRQLGARDNRRQYHCTHCLAPIAVSHCLTIENVKPLTVTDLFPGVPNHRFSSKYGLPSTRVIAPLLGFKSGS